MRELQYEDGKLIFSDYLQRKITIAEEDYLELIADNERREFRHALEECLLEPSEVWWDMETIEGVEYSYFKYFKFYRNVVFVVYVMFDDGINMTLNNFYGFREDEFDKVDDERCGNLIHSE